MDRLILGSQSPQRLALCRQLGLDPEVIAPDVDETTMPGELASDLVLRLAIDKAKAVSVMNADAVVIAGDSVVSVNEKVLGKPADREVARSMLQSLSDTTHSVFSGLAVVAGDKVFNCVAETKLSFVKLSPEIIEAYLETNEWEGKAGACCIQGMGEAFVHALEGSYSNVVGLPLHKLFEGLTEVGFSGGAFWGATSGE